MADMFTLTDSQFVSLAVSYVDKAGNSAPVHGAPMWTTSDAAIVAVQNVAMDGMSVDAVAMGPLGAVQVSVTADADLGDGVTSIVGLITITVIAGQAVSAVIMPGMAQEKP